MERDRDRHRYRLERQAVNNVRQKETTKQRCYETKDDTK